METQKQKQAGNQKHKAMSVYLSVSAPVFLAVHLSVCLFD